MLLSLHILLIKNRSKDERETKTFCILFCMCFVYIPNPTCPPSGLCNTADSLTAENYTLYKKHQVLWNSLAALIH